MHDDGDILTFHMTESINISEEGIMDPMMRLDRVDIRKEDRGDDPEDPKRARGQKEDGAGTGGATKNAHLNETLATVSRIVASVGFPRRDSTGVHETEPSRKETDGASHSGIPRGSRSSEVPLQSNETDDHPTTTKETSMPVTTMQPQGTGGPKRAIDMAVPSLPAGDVDGDLSNCSVEDLRRILGPVVTRLEGIDARELLHLSQSSRGACVGEGSCRVRPIHELITPPHRIDATPSNPTGQCVRYLHVHEEPDRYSAGIFVFPPGGRIPLHDHPGMCVMSRVLYGELAVDSYDWVEGCDEDQDMREPPAAEAAARSSSSSSWLLDKASKLLSSAVPHRQWSSGSDWETGSERDDGDNETGGPAAPRQPSRRRGQPRSGWKRARRVAGRSIAAPQVTMLFPREGNVHEFTAGEHGAAVLDILLPPYDFDHDRDCTFYEEERRQGCGGGGGGTRQGGVDAGELCWLVPVPQPRTFHCISGRYGGLGEEEEE